ncbi:hypothetical protein NI390_05600 [Vibrio fluvialis]|uniref:hypothetical protein n=1 Tax=Vibrio fluvialis TaxID=676 RepID=UPI0027E3CB75|nr:hypothetical protein [Vibrio fluvialis]WMN56478.1 hypothetical protein NI390_05600 [Vibrio fluvialis]
MKRNLLVAAAITAILSGCGGGDEGESSAVQLTVDPAEDKITLNPIVSQNDPNAIKKRVLRKPSGMLRMETALFLMVIRKKGGLPQSALCQVN